MSRFTDYSIASPGSCILHSRLHVLAARHQSLSPISWVLMICFTTSSISTLGSESRSAMVIGVEGM